MYMMSFTARAVEGDKGDFKLPAGRLIVESHVYAL